jgi:hypothetical protein
MHIALSTTLIALVVATVDAAGLTWAGTEYMMVFGDVCVLMPCLRLRLNQISAELHDHRVQYLGRRQLAHARIRLFQRA